MCKIKKRKIKDKKLSENMVIDFGRRELPSNTLIIGGRGSGKVRGCIKPVELSNEQILEMVQQELAEAGVNNTDIRRNVLYINGDGTQIVKFDGKYLYFKVNGGSEYYFIAKYTTEQINECAEFIKRFATMSPEEILEYISSSEVDCVSTEEEEKVVHYDEL